MPKTEEATTQNIYLKYLKGSSLEHIFLVSQKNTAIEFKPVKIFCVLNFPNLNL